MGWLDEAQSGERLQALKVKDATNLRKIQKPLSKEELGQYASRLAEKERQDKATYLTEISPQQFKKNKAVSEKIDRSGLSLLERPLIYLNNPLKIAGDLTQSFIDNTPTLTNNPFPTSEEDRLEIAKNRWLDEGESKLSQGLKYVPEAALNVAGDLGTFMAIPKVIKGTMENFVKPIARDMVDLAGPYGAFAGEAWGALRHNKANKAAVQEGKEWLTNWTQHPKTHERIDNLFNEYNEYFKPSKDLIEWNNELANEMKSYTPFVDELPIKRHLDLLAEKNYNIHTGNAGSSFSHSDPYPSIKTMSQQNRHNIDPFEGTWVSRSTSIPQDKRVLTTIHEGTHDWLKSRVMDRSGLYDRMANSLPPEKQLRLNIWQNDRQLGRKSSLPSDAAYEAYIANPTEMHARIMELRKQYNLTPETTNISYQKAREMMLDADNWKISGAQQFMENLDYDPNKLVGLMKLLPVGVGVAAGTQALQQEVPKMKHGGIIEDDMGQWAHPGKVTKINSNNITMKHVNYPVLGISNTGDEQLMMPGENYKFDGDSVIEYPMSKNGRWLDNL